VTLDITGASTTARTTTDANGDYRFTGLPNGTYTVGPKKLGHAISPARMEVVVAGANESGHDFAATALATYDPLTSVTLDAGRWDTPEYVRTISGGKALLSIRAEGMESNLVNGKTYTTALGVVGAGGRVTTFQADISVPAASASRSGSAMIYGGLRLYYQPSANRGAAYLQNQLTAALELYDSGSGLRVRRRFAHCDDAACVTLGTSNVSVTDPGGFTPNGVNAWAAAAYDTTYTLTIAVNEATGVFTWTVQGGTFGSPGSTGTADVSSWASTVGMTLSNGFLSAQLHARASDASAAGGGSGALTASFDNVMVGTNGAAATLYDDFSSRGSAEATGFDLGLWGLNANTAVKPSGDGLHLLASVFPHNTSVEAGLSAPTTATFTAWQADLTLPSSGRGMDQVHLGGTFLNDGTTGAAHDGTGDIYCNVWLGPTTANVVINRCSTSICNVGTNIAQATLFAAPGHPFGAGTVHTLFQQWDAASKTFVVRLDDGPPAMLPLNLGTVAAPRVPGRWIRAGTIVLDNSGLPSTVATAIDAVVKNVRVAP
jgi:hypothetical protein